MFGLTKLFQAIGCLTAEINRTVSLFKAANDDLESRLRIEDASSVTIEHLPAPAATVEPVGVEIPTDHKGNGRSRLKAK